MANVGNHLHLHIKLSSRFGYAPFIRAVTGQVAMLLTCRSRLTENPGGEPRADLAVQPIRRGRNADSRMKFWDYRPFTRVVESRRTILNLRDYIEIKKLEVTDIIAITRDSSSRIANTTRESDRFPLRMSYAKRKASGPPQRRFLPWRRPISSTPHFDVRRLIGKSRVKPAT